jgi:hypothetical protein
LRVVDLANEAEKGVKVDMHLRDEVAKTMRELGDQYNASALVTAYVEGLESVAAEAVKTRVAYIGILQAAAAEARKLRRD